MWLECIGVVSGFVVRRYIDILIIIITFPYSTCISSFFGSSIPTSLFIFNNNNNNNNNTHIAAIAPLPLTTHPRLWAQLLTFGPECTLPF